MEGTDPDVDRRTVLSTTAAGLGALLAPGVAAARPGNGRGRGRGRRGPPDHAELPEHARPFEPTGSGLELAVSREEWQQAQERLEDVTPDGAKALPYDDVEAAVAEINDAVEDGELEPTSGDEIGFVPPGHARASGGDR